ncbi:MAG: MGMT family protein [Solirubrobacteraceae bacterium]
MPYGRTTTYGDLARELGITISGSLVTGRSVVPSAQKVAAAITATPTPIVVPCHRVSSRRPSGAPRACASATSGSPGSATVIAAVAVGFALMRARPSRGRAASDWHACMGTALDGWPQCGPCYRRY